MYYFGIIGARVCNRRIIIHNNYKSTFEEITERPSRQKMEVALPKALSARATRKHDSEGNLYLEPVSWRTKHHSHHWTSHVHIKSSRTSEQTSYFTKVMLITLLLTPTSQKDASKAIIIPLVYIKAVQQQK